MVWFYKVMFGLSLVMAVVFLTRLRTAKKSGSARDGGMLRWVVIGLDLTALSYLFRMHDAVAGRHLSLGGFACGLAGALALGMAWAEHVRLRTERLHDFEPMAANVPRTRSPFSLGAYQALLQAQQEAWSRGQACLEAEHLLLGLLQGRQSGALQALNYFQVSPTRLERTIVAEIAPVIHTSKAVPGSALDAMSERAVQIISFAAQEAHRFDSPCIQTEHLLLGLLLRGDTAAARALFQEGLTVDRMRQELLASRPFSAGKERLR